MEKLPNQILLESYHTAVKLQLNPEFVSLMEKEIEKRRIKYELENKRIEFWLHN